METARRSSFYERSGARTDVSQNYAWHARD